jgi:hypothetical protein
MTAMDGDPKILAEPERLALAAQRPVTLVGLMGSGKSSIGKRLAARLNLPFVDADDLGVFLDALEQFARGENVSVCGTCPHRSVASLSELTRPTPDVPGMRCEKHEPKTHVLWSWSRALASHP